MALLYHDNVLFFFGFYKEKVGAFSLVEIIAFVFVFFEQFPVKKFEIGFHGYVME